MTIDEPAREAIRSRLDATLFVEASAGTGKTSALVSRIIELVKAGTPMRRIAAITFTEAAAAELRDRVRESLERSARSGEVAREAVAEVDEAAISTLHSYAQRLVSEHPFEAGLPPAIEVLDEISSQLDFDERWRHFMDGLFSDPAYEPVLLRAFALDFRIDSLREVGAIFLDQRDRLPLAAADHPPLLPVDSSSVVTAVRAAAAMIGHCTEEADLLVSHLNQFEGWAAQLAAADDELEALHLLQTLPRFKVKKGQARNWSCPVEDVQEAAAAAEAARDVLLAAVREDLLLRLLEAVRQFTIRSAAERQVQGRLVFHDLLVCARDLLRSSPEVRAHLHQRFTHILIDEFQDTDPLQVELAVLLATADPTAGDRAWEEVELEPGRLFFVGDAKQSIYRFRRADIDLFLRVRESKADDIVHLTTNFRSVPGVIDWVNAVLGELIGAGATGRQPEYESLAPHREPLDDRAAVHHFGHEHPTAAMARVREVEATELANALRSMVATGWLVGEAADRTRPARFDDIAILIPTRTGLPQLEAALDDAEVPYRVESASLVWSTQQVRELLSVLRSVDDPNDEVSLVAALRSPVLGCSDDHLLSYRTAGGRWDHTASPPAVLADSHPVVAGMALVRRLHEQRWWLGVAGMVDRVVRELGFFEQGFAHRRPRDHWRRLRFVADQARAFEEGAGATMRGFLQWAEHQSSEAARVREPVLPESDDEAVRILTVHGAKGLEFPIVVLAGLNRRHQRDGNSVRVLWDVDGRIQAKAGKCKTAGFASVQDDEAEMDRLERLRLLYVAATRARDHLVVSLHRKHVNCDASLLCEAIEAAGAEDLWTELGPPPFMLLPPPVPAPTPEEADRPESRQRWYGERAALLAANRQMITRSATSIAGTATKAVAGSQEQEPGGRIAGLSGALAGLDQLDPLGGPNGSLPGRRGRAGTAIGRAVHACLQAVDLVSGRDARPLATAQAEIEGIAHLADEVMSLVHAAIASPTVREAARRRHWRELYVGAPVADTLIEGFIDLLYEDADGGLVVVDYKTDRLRSADDERVAVDLYRLQLATYALALEVSLGRPVAGAVLLFVSGPAPRARPIEDLPGAVAEVRRVLAAAPRPSFVPASLVPPGTVAPG